MSSSNSSPRESLNEEKEDQIDFEGNITDSSHSDLREFVQHCLESETSQEYYDKLNVSDDQTRDISTEAQTSDSGINTSDLKNYLCASYEDNSTASRDESEVDQLQSSNASEVDLPAQWPLSEGSPIREGSYWGGDKDESNISSSGGSTLREGSSGQEDNEEEVTGDVAKSDHDLVGLYLLFQSVI
jgi:hypothetical protein